MHAGAAQRILHSNSPSEGNATGAEPLVSAAQFFAGHGRPAGALEIASGIAMRDMTMPAYQKRRDRVWLRQAKALERSLRKKV